jgi:hypothetical protein
MSSGVQFLQHMHECHQNTTKLAKFARVTSKNAASQENLMYKYAKKKA